MSAMISKSEMEDRKKLVQYLNQDEDPSVRARLQTILACETDPELKKFWLKPVDYQFQDEDNAALEALLEQKAVQEARKGTRVYLMRSLAMSVATVVLLGFTMMPKSSGLKVSLSAPASMSSSRQKTIVYQEGLRVVEERRKVLGSLQEQILFVDLVLELKEAEFQESWILWVPEYMKGYQKLRFRLFNQKNLLQPVLEGYACEKKDSFLEKFSSVKEISGIFVGFHK